MPPEASKSPTRSKMIVSKREVSKPGAALRVYELELSAEWQKRLMLRRPSLWSRLTGTRGAA
ncbi:MAG: hypothetical protein ACK46I_04260 [Phycisphaerae bacterium]|jgi:hypothetical protein